MGKSPENMKIVEFPRSEPFNQKFQNENENASVQMEMQEFRSVRKFKLCISREDVPFYENSGKYCPIRYWKFPEIWSRIFHQMESTPRLIKSQGMLTICQNKPFGMIVE